MRVNNYIPNINTRYNVMPQNLTQTNLHKCKPENIQHNIYVDIYMCKPYGTQRGTDVNVHMCKPESIQSGTDFNIHMCKPESVQRVTNSVSFGYSHKLKSMWKDGLLPSVKKGLYGGKLTKHSVSLEHIQPHSHGGPTVEWNLALADRFLNSNRGNEPLSNFLTKHLAVQYLEQFRDVKIKTENYKFTGNDYIRKLVHTFRRNGVDVTEYFNELM